jgi:hypothetical protein
MIRKLKPELLLAENIRTLLYRRNLDAGALANWCGHGDSWISKIVNTKRGIKVAELGKIADFFGLQVDDLFRPGISEIAERRKGERRVGANRRAGEDRRRPIDGRLHPDLRPRFPPRRDFDEDRQPPRPPKRRPPTHGNATIPDGTTVHDAVAGANVLAPTKRPAL